MLPSFCARARAASPKLRSSAAHAAVIARERIAEAFITK
jgi:hypothetical protein